MDYPRLLRKLRWPVAMLLLVCYASVSWAQTEPGQPPWAEERARLKMTLQEKDPVAFARATHATDRAVAAMNVAQLSIYTFNFGNQLGRIFTPGRGDFPNPEGTRRGYWFTSSPAFGVDSGPWHPNAMVHESSDYHSSTKIDWEAKDGARGVQFADPPQLLSGYPVYAVSDLPLTWPSSGWPAPENVSVIWAGTDTWNKWERIGDRNAYNVFNDDYADREGDGQSISLGIEVKKRAIAYGAMNLIFMQYEYENTSSNTYTGVYIGAVADKGSPTRNDWTGAYMVYDESRQLIWSRAVNFDTRGDGTHVRPSTGEQVSFVGYQVIESPTGSFKEFPYDPDNPGDNYVDPANTANIMTRVVLIDWDDRVLQDEAGLYGALSGRDDLMESGDATNIWKLGQGGGSPIYKQNSVHYQGYNASWDSSTDHFYYCASGGAPEVGVADLTMAPGDTYDYIVAFVAGYTEPEMLSVADQAMHTYNIKFAGPAAPPAPSDFRANGIKAGPAGREYDPRIHRYEVYYAPSGNITLSWDPSGSITAPDPSSGALDFEGIRVYRSMDRGAHWGAQITNQQGSFDHYAPVVQWDLANGVTGDDGLSYTYLGDDTGIVTSWTDIDAQDGVEYWYAIASYDQGEFLAGAQVLRSLESPTGSDPTSPTVIAVIAGSRPAGWNAGMVDGDATATIDPTVGGPYDSDASVTVNVAVDAEVVDATYRVTTADSGSYGTIDKTGVIGVTLERLTPTAATLYEALLPEDSDYGEGLLPITEGVQVEVSTLINSDDPWDLIDHTFPTGYAPYGGYEMLYGDEWFMNSELSHNSLTDLAERYTSVEIRFDTTQTQMAYVYNRTGGYDYVGYNSFPGTAWDVDASPERQVNIAYTRQNAKGANLDWDIDDDPLGANRHYTSVLASDYSGATPDTAYTTGTKSHWSGSELDHMWSCIPGMDTGLTWRDLHGTTLSYEYLHPMGPGWQYEFSTTAPTLEDTLIDLDDIKVVPNPYYVYAEWDQSNNRRKIQFTNVPAESEIQIYTLSGELVAILDHHGDATATAGGRGYNSNRIGTVEWNIWTYEFTEAAYGLYIYVVKTDDGQTKVGKFAIIR
jgi:hypothetical protein